MSIRFYTVNLTRTDSRMKVSLKGLPNTLRGDAWPTSACVVRWSVKSGNRRDPYVYLHLNNIQTALVTRRKVRATLGEYVPNALGYTRAAMLHSKGCNTERWSQSHKLQLSSDWGLQLTLMTLEFVVIGFYQSPVNMSMLLALTEINVPGSFTNFNLWKLKGQRIFNSLW